MKQANLISVIVTTYNWPTALLLVLESLQAQKSPGPFEIIVADDGSSEATQSMIESLNLNIPLIHVWQEDKGFRASRIRNLAVKKARGEYIIFIDGDCVLPSYFLQRHRNLMQKHCFVGGNRVLLNSNLTQVILSTQEPIYRWSIWKWCQVYLSGAINRLLPLLNLGCLYPRKYQKISWQGVKGCNFACWREDIEKVGGWDETFTGWGYEDSELVVRLLASGIQRLDGRFHLPVFHLWHEENDRKNEVNNLKALYAKMEEVNLAGAEK